MNLDHIQTPFVIHETNPFYSLIFFKEDYVFTKTQLKYDDYRLLTRTFKISEKERIVAIKEENQLKIVKVIIIPDEKLLRCKIKEIKEPTREEVEKFLADVVRFYVKVRISIINDEIKRLQNKLKRLELYKKLAEKFGYNVLQRIIKEEMTVVNSISIGETFDSLYPDTGPTKYSVLEGEVKTERVCHKTVYPGSQRKHSDCVLTIEPKTDYAIVRVFYPIKGTFFLVKRSIIDLMR